VHIKDLYAIVVTNKRVVSGARILGQVPQIRTRGGPTREAAIRLGVYLLGGDALNGYVQNDHYFVCAHGACNEVSRATWSYSYWHAISAYAGIVLMFIKNGRHYR
jgi:hypothetical protein